VGKVGHATKISNNSYNLNAQYILHKETCEAFQIYRSLGCSEASLGTCLIQN